MRWTSFLAQWASLFLAATQIWAKPAESQRLDDLFHAAWKAEGVEPMPLTDDATFVRRIYLDTVGRIPTAAESRSFIADTSLDKREKLIAELLSSDGYVSHWFNYWADLLRANTESAPGGTRLSQEAYIRYIRDSLRDNKPYDVFVRELLTKEGSIWDCAANGYYLRDQGMPLDNLSNTVQVFLGTRIVCAQCHDHPFDKWTQMDYYKMAAFTYGVKTTVRPEFQEKMRSAIRQKARTQAEEEIKLNEVPQKAVIAEALPAAAPNATESDPQLAEKARKEAEKAERLAKQKHQEKLRNKAEQQVRLMERKYQRAFQPIQNLIRGSQTRNTAEMPKLPKDYQYADAKPGTEIRPQPMFGSISLGDEASPVQAFAKWMTSPDNPRFTTVIANRLFKEVIGRGLIEPVDEYLDSTQASHPAIMKSLEELLKAKNYDLKAYLTVLFNSDLYQRQSWTKDVEVGSRFSFAGPMLRRMSAEQAWDSFLTLLKTDVDVPDSRREQRYFYDLTRARRLTESLNGMAPDALLVLAEELVKETENNADQIADLQKELSKAREIKDKVKMADIGKQLNQLRNDLEKTTLRLIEKKSGVGLSEEAVKEAAKPLMEAELAEFEDASDGEEADIDLAQPNRPDFASMTPEQRQEWRKQRQERRKGGKEAREAQKLAQSGYYRAAYMSSPAPRGHFLREFGQSDREVIENASDEATVPQALNLLNGPIFNAITNGKSVLTTEVLAQTTPESQIDVIYQALLSRPATDSEKSTLLNVLHERGSKEGLKDIVHALINTRQFLYIR